MAITRVKASPEIHQLVNEIREKNHPHLNNAIVAVEVVDSKPYIKQRLNLGKVSRFSKATKLWFANGQKYDFCLSICADVWYSILNAEQKIAYIDLLLSRCQVEYLPETIEVNGKKKVVKDEYGRVNYTDEIKTDDEGQPVWKIVPLDIAVLSSNIRRCGIWYDDLVDLKTAVVSKIEE